MSDFELLEYSIKSAIESKWRDFGEYELIEDDIMEELLIRAFNELANVAVKGVEISYIQKLIFDKWSREN